MKKKRKLGRKLLSFLLTLAMIVGLMPGMGLTAYAADNAKYREYAWNETSKTLSYEDKDIPVGVTELTTDTVSWTEGGWYIVPEEGVTIGNRITVTGTVNLILRDGATLTASKGITVNSGNTINIYAQIGGTGELNAGSDLNVASIGGGARYQSSGTVNIHGGKITATGGSNASGIGGALDGGNGEVNIYGGNVTARGKNYAAGIGGYSKKSGGTVNIYGGTVNASGSQYGTTGIGIGGTNPGNCVVHIYGGEVTATSEKAAAGIQGTVTIDGGTVTATGGVSDSISSFGEETYSSNGINGTVTVNGGTVTATGGNVTGDINNYGGTIYACNGVNGTVTISGGTVTATGGSHTGQFSSNGGTTVKEKGFGGSLTIGDSMKVLGGDSADPTTEIEKSNDDYARFKYMLVKLGHVHSFTYEANDATIKATCSQNDCTLNDGQGNHTAILTIGAPTLNTYGQTGAGISAEATITDADNIKGTATVVYKKGDETLASAPTDAGTYTASITLGTVTASVEYTIAQKEVTVSGITASDKIYAGNTDATLVTTAAAFTGKLDGDTLTVSATGTFDNANVGENKTVTISNLTLDGTSKDNYVLAATGQQTTTTAKITAREIGLIWSDTELTYTGEAQKPTATATGVVEGDTCTVIVSGEQTNIGDNYTATAESLSNSNYKLPENKTTTFKIVKGNAVAATVTANNRTYDGTEKPLVTVTGTVTGGTMQYALGDANEATQPYTTSIPTATDAGTYYVWYKAVGDSDHSDSEAKAITVDIRKKTDSHTHNIRLVEAKEPTCTEDGNKEYYVCPECGRWFEDATGSKEITDRSSYSIKATGHKWDKVEITKEATYDEEGIRTYTCSVCGETKTESIKKKERPSSYDDSDDSSSDDSDSGSSSSSGSSSKRYTEAQAKVDQINNVSTYSIPENHQVETGVPASDVGGRWGNNANADTWTYTKSDGTLAKSEWMSLDYNGLRYWYYFNDDGNMHTNWFDYKGERFYLMPDKDGWRGRMATGWKNIDNKWYYFDIVPGSSQGRLYRSSVTPDGHTVGADGAWNGVGATPVGQE